MWVCRNPIAEVGNVSYALCIEDDMSTQYVPAGPKPDDIVKMRRPNGRSCGSGPYYKSVKHPYLEIIKFRGPYNKTYALNSDGEKLSSLTDSGGVTYSSFCVGDTGGKMTPEDTGAFKRIPASCYSYSGKIRHGFQNFNWISYNQVVALIDAKGSLVLVSHGYFCTQADHGIYDFGIGTDPAGIPAAAIRTCERAQCTLRVDPGLSYSGTYVDTDGNTVSCIVSNTILGYENRPDPPKAEWKYDDDYDHEGDFMSITDLGIIPGDIQAMVATAYADATEQLPEVSANSLMNVMELASGLVSMKNIISGGFKALQKGYLSLADNAKTNISAGRYSNPKWQSGTSFQGTPAIFKIYAAKDELVKQSLDLVANEAKSYADPRNAWLTWRYVYNTTKMDLNDYRSVTNRLIQLAGQETFEISARASDDPLTRKNTCKCTRKLKAMDFDLESMNTAQLLRTYGFKLSLYNAWDMVPYSFMVDWFLPVGDYLESLEKWQRTQELESIIDWFSCSFQFEHGYAYMRWSTAEAAPPHIPPTYQHRSVGTKTLTYRLADTVSIFSGR